MGSGTVAWSSNGNPGSPVCPAAPDCISGFEVDDLTSGVSVTLPLTAVSYTLAGTVGVHQVEVWTTHQGNAVQTLVLAEAVQIQ